MKIINFLNINNLNNRYFNIITLFLLIIFDILFISNHLFTNLIYIYKIYHFIIQILGFLIISFLPGFIILRLLKIDEKSNILNILLVISTSIFFSTLLGLSLSLIGYSLNIKLLYPVNILIAYNLILIPLLILSNKYKIHNNLYLEFNLIQIAIIVLIPFFAIFGTYILNYFNVNIINCALIIIISIMPFLFRYKKYHSLIIWVSSISILFSTQLVSDYLWSWDIHYQYYSASLVLNNNIWNYNLPSDANSLITVVLLGPIYSFLTETSLIWIYKIVYPFLFSFVPLGIYYLVKDQFNSSKIAYFSAFVFMFYYGFFKDMIDKQFIAEIFLILILIVLLSKNSKLRNILIIPFVLMLPLTHYGVSYIFLICLIPTAIILFAFKEKEQVSITIIIFAAVSIISWHIYTSEGSVFTNIISIGNHITSSITDIIANPETRTGAAYLTKQTPSLVWAIYKIMNASLLFFMAVGTIKLCLSLLNSGKKFVKSKFYSIISIIFVFFIVFQIFSNSSLGMDRGLQISLVVLSPLIVIGFIQTVFYLKKVIRIKNINLNTNFNILAIFLCIFFIFSSGLANFSVGDNLPYSVNLNKNSEWHVYSPSEVAGIKWSRNYKDNITLGVLNPWRSIKSRDGSLTSGYYSKNEIYAFSPDSIKIKNKYLFMGNTTLDAFKMGDLVIDLKKRPIYGSIMQSNKIYTSEDSTIYLFL